MSEMLERLEMSFMELLAERGSLSGWDENNDKPGSESDKEDDDSEDDEDDSEDDDSESKPKPPKEDDSPLRSALQRERAERKRLARETKELRKFKEEAESKTKSETEQATGKVNKLQQVNEKLATMLREQAVDSVITRHAGKLKFRDAEDAVIRLRSKVEVEQDEDDPSEIEIDEDEVVKMLQRLAKDKPYLLSKDEEDDEEIPPPSGSKFNGKQKSKDQMSEEALRAKFPALRRPTSQT